jgi:hypothetical protein
MDGLVAFASQIGYCLAVLFPVFCYLGAGVLFVVAAWGFWMQAHPHNPYRGRPWVPLVSLLMSGALASFDLILTMANVTGGSTVVVSTGALGYVAPPAGASVLGADPSATVVNVVSLFQAFFQAFGAMTCLFAALAWRATVVGRSDRSQGSALVQFVFGTMLINVVTIAKWIVGLFA